MTAWKRALVIGVALALLAGPVAAQCGCEGEPTPEPIVGPGPCHSDTPWGCYAERVFLPAIQRGL